LTLIENLEALFIKTLFERELIFEIFLSLSRRDYGCSNN